MCVYIYIYIYIYICKRYDLEDFKGFFFLFCFFLQKAFLLEPKSSQENISHCHILNKTLPRGSCLVLPRNKLISNSSLVSGLKQELSFLFYPVCADKFSKSKLFWLASSKAALFFSYGNMF